MFGFPAGWEAWTVRSRKRVGRCLLSVLLWVWTGTLYFFMEVIWKTVSGRPESISWTMLLLAIFLAVPLERCGAELPWEMPLAVQSALCGAAITAVEFVAGLIINVWLGMDVWDYSHMPGNLMGQVCPQFWVMWTGLAALGIVMLDWMRYAVEGGERPHYVLWKVHPQGCPALRSPRRAGRGR